MDIKLGLVFVFLSSTIFCMEQQELLKSSKNCPHAYAFFKAVSSNCETRCYRDVNDWAGSWARYTDSDKKECVKKQIQEFLKNCREEQFK
ncbi:hypothetical protein M1446_05440 [Candidatus Dependentiae bacterium]|nr:hypothetical protein [Candidatus Dependentiae bacterium]